jgi:hypothetical protein
MVNHDNLLHRARVAYELGRWKMAARVLVLVIPVAIVCGALSQRLAATVGLTVLLGTILVVLRWRNRQGQRIANAGFTAGLLPLSAGVLMSQLGMMSSPALCMSICVGSGVLAGSWAAYALRGNRGGVADSLVVGTVALTTALFGCIDLPSNFLAGLAVATLASALIARLVQSLYVRTAA